MCHNFRSINGSYSAFPISPPFKIIVVLASIVTDFGDSHQVERRLFTCFYQITNNKNRYGLAFLSLGRYRMRKENAGS